MPVYSLLSFSLCLILLCQGSLAQTSPWHSQHRFAGPRGCRFERLEALNPSRRMQFEAGMTEYYDWNNEMMQCAGMAASRHVLQPRGLLLPHYNNAPSLMYIVQGNILLPFSHQFHFSFLLIFCWIKLFHLTMLNLL
jgi:Cupin